MSDIHGFVREALAKGIPKAEIKTALLRADWQEDEVVSALDAFADVDFPIPVPRRKPYLSAREAFIYLVLFLCLYITAFSFGKLLFDFINRWVPDVLRQYESTDVNAVRMSVSALIVAFPVYLWLTSLMAAAIRRDPEKKGSKIRKWLTYITLFITAGVIIGDLITLLFNLLGGELTLRFFLKVLTVLMIAGIIFGYYLWDLRKEEKER
jgi:ABC-type Fe3+ transport system permease subunit